MSFIIFSAVLTINVFLIPEFPTDPIMTKSASGIAPSLGKTCSAKPAVLT